MNNKPLIISVALTGAGVKKSSTPHVPITPEEIAEDVVKCAKAGASIGHIHVRDDDGNKSMSLDKFKKTVELTRKMCSENNVDILLNLTTSGGSYVDEERLAPLYELKPDICSFDAGSINWGTIIFENHPRFLEKLCVATQELNIKPEIEIFDGGFIRIAEMYINKGMIKGPAHFQFVLGAPGGLDGTMKNLLFLHDMLPKGSTWSVTGIGKTHMPMLLSAIALGADGVRVGLEDNILMQKGILATNESLVTRAVDLCRLVGRPIATAEETRKLLGI